MRAIVQWSLRCVALILIAVGSYLCLKRLLFGIGVSDMSMAYKTWTGVGEEHSLYRGLALGVVGIMLAVMSSWLSRWIITVPPDSCPRCGHPPTPGGGNVCAECGYGGLRAHTTSSDANSSNNDTGS